MEKKYLKPCLDALQQKLLQAEALSEVSWVGPGTWRGSPGPSLSAAGGRTSPWQWSRGRWRQPPPAAPGSCVPSPSNRCNYIISFLLYCNAVYRLSLYWTDTCVTIHPCLTTSATANKYFWFYKIFSGFILRINLRKKYKQLLNASPLISRVLFLSWPRGWWRREKMWELDGFPKEFKTKY